MSPHPSPPIDRLELSRDLADLWQLRAWLWRHLPEDTPPAVAEDVVLLASEVATNAIMHTESNPVLTLELGPMIRVSVHDDDPAQPRMAAFDANRPHGNGLRILDAWASDWGVARRPGDGKDVWFTVARW